MDQLTRHTLQSYFDGQQLKDYKILSELGTGMSMIDNKNEIPTVGSFVNHKRGKHKRKDTPVTLPLEVVGMDIGYCKPNSPGCHKYVLILVLVLVLVDKCTFNMFVYEMHGISGVDVGEALWKFFIEAGWFPRTIQCNFDPRFIGCRAILLLWSHGCYVCATPPQ